MRTKLSIATSLLVLACSPIGLNAQESPESAAHAKAELEEANRQIVVTMYNLLMNEHKVDEALELIGPNYIQHNVLAPDGKEFLRGAFKERFAENPNLRSDIKRTLADGDLVVIHTHERFNPEDPNDTGNAIVDIYRVEDGFIVEHWDVYAPVPPREQWEHDNGAF